MSRVVVRPDAIRDLVRGWRDGFSVTRPGEVQALAVVTGVVVALVAFRAVLPIGFFDQLDAATLTDHAETTWADLLRHLALGLLMYAVIEPVRRNGPQGGTRRWVAIGVAVLAAAFLAAAALGILQWLEAGDSEWWLSLALYVRFAFPAAMLVTVAEFHRRELLGLEAMRAAEGARAALESQTLQARLRTLEAQIEPHFLFNTLATVRRLYESDPRAGEAMLESFMAYLEMALPSMRGDKSTLGQEAEMVRAYLDLQKVRMGRRLEHRIEIPAALRAVEVPPMMLLTLVETAIKHGLAPQREGGRVEVRAVAEASALRLEVADTGRGFGEQATGGGTGLANIRARLTAMFGGAAELTLAPSMPTGLLATIRMPMQRA